MNTSPAEKPRLLRITLRFVKPVFRPIKRVGGMLAPQADRLDQAMAGVFLFAIAAVLYLYFFRG